MEWRENTWAMAKLFTITEDWAELQWFSTGGTRAKKYLQSPDGKFYYFKRSQLRPGRDYTFEFWNEIIAYELGTMLGFNMLRYDIAIDGEIMGCICESMINSEEEELIEGVKYLQAYSPGYDPAKKEHQSWYTFDLIERALQSAKIGHFINDIIKIIIFDSVIGNGDRHQENWAIITHQKLILDTLEKAEKLDGLKKWERKLISWLKDVFKKTQDLYENNKEKFPRSFFYEDEKRFAPIYDSGSSLGRELLDEKVNLYLNSPAELSRYIERGSSEIHWGNKKINHYDLIGKLLESNYKEKVKETIERLLKKFDGAKFAKMIQVIDREVPDNLSMYKIPDNRKQLIIKMITLRLEKLRALIYEGV